MESYIKCVDCGNEFNIPEPLLSKKNTIVHICNDCVTKEDTHTTTFKEIEHLCNNNEITIKTYYEGRECADYRNNFDIKRLPLYFIKGYIGQNHNKQIFSIFYDRYIYNLTGNYYELYDNEDIKKFTEKEANKLIDEVKYIIRNIKK